MRVGIITNGTLLSDRLEDIMTSGLHRISVSVNSIEPGEYQRICGTDEKAFADVINGIQLLVKHRNSAKPYIHISFVLTWTLFYRVPEIIRFAEEMRVDYLDFHNLILNDPDHDADQMLTTDDEEVVRKFSEWKRKHYRVQVRWPRLVQKHLEKPARICGTLWKWLGVDMEGNTAGCSKAMPTDQHYGNVFQDGPQVWNNQFRQTLRQAFLEKKRFLFACCKTCTEVQP
jgi:radical SAM protein with 4Fe4S-binding SPASM domain